ncbi:FKBP-type peptidyl-prolyl cis-trans isomerase [Pedobacter antarcticus]|uniref:FKBP-type peptidyl-prolyl cis-trans isomerase n=1 Tax=Pedobacter antarcticus TaxID=34086 RepID=UPI00293048F3|nr:FKBP-type peptidyl-prolyl cis-trans isomerase [Pedobacter antarcticus]
MKKIKYLLLFVVITAAFASCKKFGAVDNFDHAGQFITDTTLIRKFITENEIPAIKHESGVFYQIIDPGEGDVKYTTDTKIFAEYEGRLLNGTVFDKSKGSPISFMLKEVIPGWQIGIPLIQKGGKIRLLIPSQYGYRNSAIGVIPPSSVLDFTVNLADVINN